MISDNILICPICHEAKHVIPILYGDPIWEMVEKAKKGEIRIGGCLISPDRTTHYCKSCEIEFNVEGRVIKFNENPSVRKIK